eukprot:8400201-Alexandrium_andersonii.AAC.1
MSPTSSAWVTLPPTGSPSWGCVPGRAAPAAPAEEPFAETSTCAACERTRGLRCWQKDRASGCARGAVDEQRLDAEGREARAGGSRPT